MELEGLLAKATEAGVNSIDGFNEWTVKERAAEPVAEVLREWRDGSAQSGSPARAGLDGEQITIVGEWCTYWIRPLTWCLPGRPPTLEWADP
jgi:hypothetical protein